MPTSTSTDRSKRSQQRKNLGHPPEPQGPHRPKDFVRILTPSNIVYLGAPLSRRSVDSSAMRPGKGTSSKGRPISLDMPRPSAPAAITSSSTTHALPASISTTSASPALTTTSVSALLTQFNAPERGTTHSRASSIASDSPKRPQTPQLGPVARLRESGNSNRAPQSPNSAELGQDSSVDDSFAGSYSIPKRRSSLVGPQHDAGVSPVQLGRRLRATTNSVDESLPRSRNVTFDSTADTQDSRSSAPSSPGENAEPVGGDYKEPEVFGEVSTESFGAALQSLKEIESRNNSSTAAKESTGLGSDLPMPAEALQVLEQATKHSEDLSEVDRDRATAELRAHSEKQLINEQDKERRQSELDSFQEQSERNERSVLAEQIEPSTEESQSGRHSPSASAEPFIETSEPRLRRRRNFSASQKAADAEGDANVVEPVQPSDSVTEKTPGATEGTPGAIMEAPIVAGDMPGAIRETPGAIGHTRGAVGPEQADALDAFVPPSMQVIHAGNDDGSDGSAQVSQAPAESVESGASILADSAPVKAESDTTVALEGATVAQEPSAEDAKVTAALTGAAPSIESAEQSEEVNDVKSKAVGPEGVEKAKVAEPATTEGAKELLPDSRMTTSTDRNASHRKPGKLTAIERQIKEDGARVSSVTGKGRPGYEVPVKKQKGPRIPINVSLNLQVTIPKRAHAKLPATTTTSGDIGVNLSNKLTYNVQCIGLEISRSSPVGRLLTFGITAAIWILWATGNW